MNAYDGLRQYEDIAIDLGNNATKYRNIRHRLIDTALQTNPMHPYWDAPRYVKNLESGLMTAWELFLSGEEPRSIEVVESSETSKGTYEETLVNNPSDRRDYDEL